MAPQKALQLLLFAIAGLVVGELLIQYRPKESCPPENCVVEEGALLFPHAFVKLTENQSEIYAGFGKGSKLYQEIENNARLGKWTTLLKPTPEAIADFKHKHQLSDMAFKDMQEELIGRHVSFDDIGLLEDGKSNAQAQAKALSRASWEITMGESGLKINGIPILGCWEAGRSYEKGHDDSAAGQICEISGILE